MSLKHQTVIGALWSVAASVGGRAVGLIGTLVLTHFLVPAEYGIVSVGIVLVGTVNGLSTLGFGQYVTANPDADDSTVFHATVIHLVTGVVGLGAVLLARESFDRWFGAPGLGVLVPGIVLATAIERVAYMPGRVLARDMRFRVLAARLLFGELAYTAVAVGLAMHELGAGSLVWGLLARQAVAAAITLGALHHRRWFSVGPLSFSTAGKMVAFSGPMAAANWLQWLARRGDNLLVAWLFGPAAVGKYNLAYNLADVPATQVGEHIGDVLLPSFAKMKSAEAQRQTLVRASGLLALVVFPLAVGLAVIAGPLVQAVLGPAWWDVAAMLVVLSALSVVRPVGWLVGAYLQATCQTRTILWLEALRTVAVGGLVISFGQIGLLAACFGVGIAFALHSAGSIWVVHRRAGVSVSTLVRPFGPPLLACVPMVMLVTSVTALADHFRVAAWATLVAALVCGAASYVLGALTLAPTQSRDLLSLLREVVDRRRRTEPAAHAAATR